MKDVFYLMGILSLISSCFVGKSRQVSNSDTVTPSKSIYSLSVKSLDGSKTITLSDYKGKYLVFVNTASECGYTYQYKDLQEFYTKYGKDSVVLIGFPCNQFGGQEPGTAGEIEKFCQENYGVTFPMSEKIDVKGENQHPIFKWLTHKSENGAGDFEVKWNFNKFVVNPDGQLTHYFGSAVKPGDSVFLKSMHLN